jgi:hypothetical protein
MIGSSESPASDSLLDRKDELADAITEVLYHRDPSLTQRFGESGRAKCRQDMRYSLEHLAPAVALHDTSLFARYVTWLESMLAARGVGSGDVRRSLEATQHVLSERLSPDEAAQVIPSVQAGLNALSRSTAA